MSSPIKFPKSKIKDILKVPYFKESKYSSLDVEGTIDYFCRYFIKPITQFTSISEDTVVADIGAGYGWLSISWALQTPASVVAIDMDVDRLNAARQIADILGVGDRIDWRPGALGSLPLEDRSVDIACCIEVLEHVYGNEAAVVDLGRVSRNLVLLTTPNKWFPMIAHDTRLPFCHWLPVPLRRLYAAAFGRTNREVDNLFWSSPRLARLLSDYERVSGFMHFEDLTDYLDVFPYYLPYGEGKKIERISNAKKTYFGLASKFGRHSQMMLPNLASIYRRR